MNHFQALLHAVEVGRSRVLIRLVPLIIGLIAIALAYNMRVYRGLDDSASMDNAQLARQLARGEGFTTKFLRPYAVNQLRAYHKGELFAADATGQRVLPDTYNAPGYPCLLAFWFAVLQPNFSQTPQEISARHIYSGDRVIPILNQFLVLLTGAALFVLGLRLFDARAAWIALVAFWLSDLVWKFSLTALPTNLLMLLATVALLLFVEIYLAGEAAAAGHGPFWPAWIWGGLLGLLLAPLCLSYLPALALVFVLAAFLFTVPRMNFFLLPIIVLPSLAAAALWGLHLYRVSGNPFGSNLSVLLAVKDGAYDGNRVFCLGSIPPYDPFFQAVNAKEMTGFRWHLQHAWEFLGATPLVVFFATSYLHAFRRPRAQVFRWLVALCGVLLVAGANLNVAQPEALSLSNVQVFLLPAVTVIGAAYLFILIDRLNSSLWFLNSIVVVAVLAISALPMLVSWFQPGNSFYAYPPYVPPAIRLLGQFAHTDEWVTTDMPWATAWYADHSSLWLPDKLNDFYDFHDHVCPTGVILVTEVTTANPLDVLRTGEYHEWGDLIISNKLPDGFPLPAHSGMPNHSPDYQIWSDNAHLPGQH